jgi:hypothetical protein
MLHESEKGLNGAITSTALSRVPQIGEPTALFESAEWYALLAHHCFDQSPVAISATSGASDCTLMMVADGAHGIRSLSNWYSFRWRPQFSGAGHDDVQRSAALSEALRQLRKSAAHALFTPVPVANGEAEGLVAALQHAGWHVRAKVQSRNCWANIKDQSFDDWWAKRPGQLRSTLTRKGKKGVVDIRIIDAFNDNDWSAYEQVYAHSWKDAEGHPAFLRALAETAARRGALRLGLASVEGRVVAAQFWTIEAGTASIHKLAQLTDAEINAHSPGTLLTHALYRHAVEQDRVGSIDFGTGSDGFKNGWTDTCTDLMTIEAVDLKHVNGWRHIGALTLSRLAARFSGR